MTPAEFKSIREGLGLTAQALADILGLKHLRTVQRWDSGERAVPADVAATMQRLDANVEKMVAGAISTYGRMPGADVVLLRYRGDDDMAQFDARSLKALHSSAVHAAAVERTRQALTRTGVNVRIVYMDPEAYTEWLSDRSDGPARRAQWAALSL